MCTRYSQVKSYSNALNTASSPKRHARQQGMPSISANRDAATSDSTSVESGLMRCFTMP